MQGVICNSKMCVMESVCIYEGPQSSLQRVMGSLCCTDRALSAGVFSGSQVVNASAFKDQRGKKAYLAPAGEVCSSSVLVLVMVAGYHLCYRMHPTGATSGGVLGISLPLDAIEQSGRLM